MGSLPRRVISRPRPQKRRSKAPCLNLGWSPPHTRVLGDLVIRLQAAGLDTTAFQTLPLKALCRMGITSRYPIDATPPADLFDRAETDQAIAVAAAVIVAIEALDRESP